MLDGEEEADGESNTTFELLMTTYYQTPISALNTFLPQVINNKIFVLVEKSSE